MFIFLNYCQIKINVIRLAKMMKFITNLRIVSLKNNLRLLFFQMEFSILPAVQRMIWLIVRKMIQFMHTAVFHARYNLNKD
jgi:hypothetical protein